MKGWNLFLALSTLDLLLYLIFLLVLKKKKREREESHHTELDKSLASKLNVRGEQLSLRKGTTG